MQDQLGLRILFSWSVLVKYAIVSAINLAILLVGIAIGVMLAPRIEKKASADDDHQAATQQRPVPPNDTVTAVKTTAVQPSLTTGTVGIYLVLSHHIQSDELVVNGYDLLKLQNGELQLLSRFVPPAEIQKMVNDSKASELFTVSQPAQETPKPSPK